MRRIVIAILTLAALPATAQYEGSSFTTTGRGVATTFVTDYQALGINPANLGWTWQFEEKKVALGFNELTYSTHSNALSKKELRQEVSTMIRNKTAEDFTYQEKVAAAKSFADEGLSMNVDYGSLGAAFTDEKFGGIAFRIADRIQWYSQLGPQASELLFLGRTAPYFDSVIVNQGGSNVTLPNDSTLYNPDSVISGFTTTPSYISDIMNGSRLSMSWYREYNLSYGRKIFEKDSLIALYGGVGIKYLQGIAILDINGQGDQFDGFSALSPFFDIDYGTAAMGNPSALTPTTSFPPKSVGSGWGFDVGANVVLFNKLKIGAAVNNIGSITWDGNVYSLSDTLVYDTENAGLESYNVFNSIKDVVGDDGLLKLSGETSRTVKLPTVMRLGASYKVGKIAEIGVDVIMPGNEVPGSYEGAIIGFGGDIQPLPWVRIQAGFVTGGNYGPQVPLGIMIFAPKGGYEFGIASRDALTFFTQNGPTLSLSLGFMRFRF